MNITVYSNFAKRKNSTKLPTGGTSLSNVYLKDDCSIINPVFMLQTTTWTYTYIKWDTRYYFVDNIVSLSNNLTEYHCSLDPLATHKSTIGSYNAFIDRSYTAYDPYLYDSCISTQQQISSVDSKTESIGMFSSTGCYIFPCMNKYGLQIFATTHIDDFAPMFYPGTYGISDFTDWLKQGIANIGDLAQYFGKVLWIPYDLSTIVSPQTTTIISVGTLSWNTANPVYILDPTLVVSNRYVSYFNKFDPVFNDFRDSHPAFTRYSLFIPGVGIIPVDPMYMTDPTRYIFYSIDFTPATGAITVDLELQPLAGQGTGVFKIGHYNGNIAANVPYGITSADVGGVVTPIVNGVAGAVKNAAMENYAGAAASLIGGAFESIHNDATPPVNMYGGSGSLGDTKYHHDFIMSREIYGSAGIPDNNIGRPLHQYRTINTLSGYIKCAKASLDSIALGEVKDQINNYLNTGFYYE